ncbi:MAG: hypothetical protein ABSB79_04580 [Syntrophales bacterium]|jgi:hypothetical protein
MTRAGKGNFKTKHPPETKVPKSLSDAIKKATVAGNISCISATEIAERKSMGMQEVGTAIDIMEINIVRCQLGLFGYSPEKMVVKAAKSVSKELENAILSGVRKDRLPCAEAWRIADSFKIPRMRVAAACEALKIKVKPCQLGAF